MIRPPVRTACRCVARRLGLPPRSVATRPRASTTVTVIVAVHLRDGRPDQAAFERPMRVPQPAQREIQPEARCRIQAQQPDVPAVDQRAAPATGWQQHLEPAYVIQQRPVARVIAHRHDESSAARPKRTSAERFASTLQGPPDPTAWPPLSSRRRTTWGEPSPRTRPSHRLRTARLSRPAAHPFHARPASPRPQATRWRGHSAPRTRTRGFWP